MLLLIDCHNLIFREAYSKQGLMHNGIPTGAILGFLRQLEKLTKLYSGEVCLCWDSRESLRKEFHPEYKANRHSGGEMPDEIKDIFIQKDLLKEEILPRLGYKNSFIQRGYEADDLIASLCSYSGTKVIISSDNDLFQCLGPSVFMHNVATKKVYTYKDFQEEYGVSPMQWADVKAIAGDGGDNVIGVAGVGIKTAVKCLTGRASDKVSRKAEEHREIIVRNRKLVKLPWEGCDPGEVKKSQFNEREYIRVCGEYGLSSLLGKEKK